nr:hypothetical protein [Anaerolineae bacterium]
LAVEEIPTVRRSRDQLIQADLIPFFAVTGDAQDPLSVADGLLVGHIQYQGFGENLRSITRPLTFDQAALQNLMALEPLASWHVQGGLLISDALGVPGVRRYYDPQEQAFPTRLVAREAFAAGNDVLYLGDYSTSTFSTQTAAIADTIEYFIQRYQTDVVFRERVDQSVRRIIQQKLDMYGQFAVEDVIPAEGTVEQVGQGYNIALAVASQSLSVLPPGYNEPVNPPQRGDIILIFTDTRTVQQCASCTPSPLIRVDALRSEILRSYGPDATGTVGFANIIAYSFADLKDYLDNDVGGGDGENTPEPDPVESALAAADWIVFVSIGIDPEIPASSVVKQYLSEVQPGNDTRLVVMSMGAPYYLDTTEISKLSAYYVLYNYSAPSVAVAAQALFQEVAADGAPPVSVSSADYFILEATSPDPGQIINLSYELVARTQDMGEGTPTPTIEPVISLGDTLKLTTGVILDRNGNPVPDGTQVDFILSFINEGLRDNQAHATTGGRAEASVVLSRPGEIQITAISGDARNSETITVVVQDTGPAEISVQPPDLPTQTATPTDVLSVEPTEVVEAIEEPVATPEAESGLEQVANFDDLFLAGIGLLGIALVVFAVGSNTRSLNYGLLLTFPTLISGLLFYTYYALMLPGSAVWRQVFNSASRVWAASTAAWLGGLFGLAVAIVGINLYEQGTFLNLRNRNQG